MEASGALNSLNRPNETEPAESAKVPLMRSVFKSVALTGFALEWMKLVHGFAPETSKQVQAVLQGYDRWRYVFGWFDLGFGSSALGISRAFEDYGTVIV